MRRPSILFCLFSCIAGMLACNCFSLSASDLHNSPDNKSCKYTTVTFVPDTVRVLDNPLCGWVMYLGKDWDRSQDENFWEQRGYDNMPADSGKSQ